MLKINKQTDLAPNHNQATFVACNISPVIQFDQPFHRVVQYESYISFAYSCILMKRVTENHCIIVPCSNIPTLNFFCMPSCSMRPLECKNEHPKIKICFGCVELHDFHGNLLCDCKEWGYTYIYTHISAAVYPRILNLLPNQSRDISSSSS